MTTDQDKIITLVAKHFFESKESILGKGRIVELVKPRHVAMYLLHKEGLAKKQIGRIFDVNHTAVISAIKKVESDKSLLSSAQLIALELSEKDKDLEIMKLLRFGF